MAKILKGSEVAVRINEDSIRRVNKLKEKNVSPCLAIVRVGERDDDLAYEKSAVRRCGEIGIRVKSFVLPKSSAQEELIKLICEINTDHQIHGCLLLRPLPEQFDDELVRSALDPEKDVDGITDASFAGVFAGSKKGFPPCTAAACIEIIDHFGIDVTGKRVVVIGRSLVVGKPVSMMLLRKNATVTICHTKTRDMPEICREAEVIIAAAGRAGIVGSEYLSEGQIIIDVGINIDKDGNLCGDVDFGAAEKIVEAITPVPGGVGAVTTAVLAKHVVEAAERKALDDWA